MAIEKIDIKKIKLNPDNPRTIKDDKFKKMVTSIKEFPEMLEIRPIVVDENLIVLGGNMRLKACLEVGLKQIPIIRFNDLTEEKKREFIIKDNVGYGEWDWDMINNDWDNDYLIEWGLDIPEINTDYLQENNEEEDEKEDTAPLPSDDDYSCFDLVMLYDNKIRLIKVLNDIKNELELEKQEEALMALVDYYLVNKK